MAEATPDGYRQLGRAPLLSPPEPWGPMAYKDGKLLVRDAQMLYCLDLTAGK